MAEETRSESFGAYLSSSVESLLSNVNDLRYARRQQKIRTAITLTVGTIAGVVSGLAAFYGFDLGGHANPESLAAGTGLVSILSVWEGYWSARSARRTTGQIRALEQGANNLRLHPEYQVQK